jgi:hypothetical protein
MGIIGDKKPAAAAPTVLLAHAAARATTNNTAVTTAIDTSGANLIVVMAAVDGGAGAITISDSKLNSWSSLTSQSSIPTPVGQIFYSNTTANPTVGTAHVFTLTSTSSFPAIIVGAFSNAVTAPFDVQAGDKAASINPNGTSVTPGSNNELVISGYAVGNTSGGSDYSSITGGFTLVDHIAFLPGTGYGAAMAFLKQGTLAAANPTWTLTVSDNWACCNATFKGT